MKLLPLGISDFKELIDGGFYYVDKTLLIEEIIKTSGKVILITRPRRFGKTLNLSMLRYFYECSSIDYHYLFADTTIAKSDKFDQHFKSAPVIFLTFKDVKESTWERTEAKLFNSISREFIRHQEALLKNLSEVDRNLYLSIAESTAGYTDYCVSLKFLSEKLFQHYGKRPVFLLDEYDTPINAAYNNGHYNETIDFLRSLLCGILKDNEILERGIITGILRAANEGIFSGLNNLIVATVLQKDFQDKFGFTNQEVTQILDDYEIRDKNSEIKNWYNSYRIGETQIYNPWSIIQCARADGLLEPYWANTSSNDLIKKILITSSDSFKADFELLLNGESLSKSMQEGLVFPGIEKNSSAIWSLFLFSGYLTFLKKEIISDEFYCDLVIPNREIKILFKQLLKVIFDETISTNKINLVYKALISADAITLTEILQDFVAASMSYYDLSVDEPEKSYHLFVLGLLVLLSKEFTIKSNRESGYGRYDILMIPSDKKNPGIIIEFKKVSQIRNETLGTAAQNALEQIKNLNYAQELRSMGIAKIIEFGIAFEGKKVWAKVRKD